MCRSTGFAILESYEYDDFKEFQIEGKGVTDLIKQRSEKINSVKEVQYHEALKLIEVGTAESLTRAEKMLAMAAYSELGEYKDALERISICTSNITVIQEMLELEEQLAGHKEELKSLTGFFKRRQRQEKEELINKVEQQIAELKEQLE